MNSSLRATPLQVLQPFLPLSPLRKPWPSDPGKALSSVNMISDRVGGRLNYSEPLLPISVLYPGAASRSVSSAVKPTDVGGQAE